MFGAEDTARRSRNWTDEKEPLNTEYLHGEEEEEEEEGSLLQI